MPPFEEPLKITLAAASLRRERELPGFEELRDFASESYNLAIGALAAVIAADPALASRARLSLFDIDLSAERRDLDRRAGEALVEGAPDLLGLSCYCWSLDGLLELAREVRAKNPACLIVLGGPSAGPVGEELLERHPFIDAVAQGEGEITMVALVRAILDGAPLGEVPGLTFRDPGGRVVVNGPAPTVELAGLPSAHREGWSTPEGRSMLLETSRGCRFRCRFCSWMGGRGPLRVFPSEAIEAELRWALERGLRSIKLADTAINFSDERVEALARVVRRVDPARALRFTYFLKPELLTAAQARSLRDLPAEEVVVGVESLDESARRAVGKRRITIGELEERLSLLEPVGPVTTSLILGLPGDSLGGLERTLEELLSLQQRRPELFHVICLFWLALLPGSRLWADRGQDRSRVTSTGTPYLLESRHHSPDDLLMMARAAAERHYRHPVLRLEYFHRDYLQQDAAAVERRGPIERLADDRRQVVALVGAPTMVGGRSFPYSLEALQLKAFLERDEAIRQTFRLELVHLRGRDRQLDADVIEALAPETIVLWGEGSSSLVEELRSRWPGARVILGGASEEGAELITGHRWVDLVIDGEGEGPLLEVFARGPKAPRRPRGSPERLRGSPVALEKLPSPFQWGLLAPRERGGSVALALGRLRGGEPLYFDERRLAADLRWALEEGFGEVWWAGAPMPTALSELRSLVAALRGADPGGGLRHRYGLDLAALTEEHLDVLEPLPTGGCWPADAGAPVSRQVRLRLEELGWLEEAPGGSGRESLQGRVLDRWASRGPLGGWSLEHVDHERGRLLCRWRGGGDVLVTLGAGRRHVAIELEAAAAEVAPEAARETLRALLSRLLDGR